MPSMAWSGLWFVCQTLLNKATIKSTDCYIVSVIITSRAPGGQNHETVQLLQWLCKICFCFQIKKYEWLQLRAFLSTKKGGFVNLNVFSYDKKYHFLAYS